MKLVLAGHLRNSLNLQRLRKFKSRLFTISEIEVINVLSEPQHDTEFLSISYSHSDIDLMLRSVNGADLILGVMNYRFIDNFYMYRTASNKACISISDIDRLLLAYDISIENFILKNIIELVVFKNTLGSINTKDVYQYVHRETRGCLFDMNGDKQDVLYNTEQPILCNHCKAQINSKNVPSDFLEHLKKDLSKITKSRILKIEELIRKHPLLSVLIALLGGLLINIATQLAFNLMKLNV